MHTRTGDHPCLEHLAGDVASSKGLSSVYLSFLPSSTCLELKDKRLRLNDTISISPIKGKTECLTSAPNHGHPAGESVNDE